VSVDGESVTVPYLVNDVVVSGDLAYVSGRVVEVEGNPGVLQNEM